MGVRRASGWLSAGACGVGLVVGVAACGGRACGCGDPPVASVAVNAAGVWVSDDDGVTRFDVDGGGATPVLHEAGSYIGVPTGAQLVSAGAGQRFVWAAAGRRLWQLREDGRAIEVGVRPSMRTLRILAGDADGVWLATPTGDGVARVASGGRVVARARVGAGVTAAAVSGKRLWVTTTGPWNSRKGRIHGRSDGRVVVLASRGLRRLGPPRTVGRLPWSAPSPREGRGWPTTSRGRCRLSGPMAERRR